ncbi:hypothetical protein [Nostoc sp. UHCC 0252]|uniref:hypothetical protein n=1 Tax=Nostoc sp. UHCC 0252 TaxID=3110241 RepID=UPI002B1F4795|nr:hypothetical protein [Nostoc sp. UHCC 0252]MEA5601967.1 hypothetical protein [Nostoc sp. UHCC 0252]
MIYTLTPEQEALVESFGQGLLSDRSNSYFYSATPTLVLKIITRHPLMKSKLLNYK